MKKIQVSLPPEVIEHIHSFIQGKEAVRTALLCKSVYNSWSKRPNLHFDERLFPEYTSRFEEFSKKTMQRYEDSNLKIESFTLKMDSDDDLFKELIVRAIELEAIDLKIIELINPMDIWSSGRFVLPVEVFGSKTLASLSMTNGIIDLSAEVTCSMLKSLHLSGVTIIGDLFTSLISRCPLIERLVCDADLLSFSNVRCENEFRELKSLSLTDASDKDPLFFQDLLLKFPFLRNLAIQGIDDRRKIRICSQSLHCISILGCYGATTMEIDAPNIRRFHYEGFYLPCFTFETTVGDWESDIRVMCFEPSSSCLSSLRKLLLNLSQSKVSLSVYVKDPSIKYVCDYTSCEPKPAVENLNIMVHAPNSGLLDCLFMICRPKLVNLAPSNN